MTCLLANIPCIRCPVAIILCEGVMLPYNHVATFTWLFALSFSLTLLLLVELPTLSGTVGSADDQNLVMQMS